ncbi:MAG: creatininase family protein [Sedimentisphaerales bacterium]|nr:creatininase family protein [Sedimentisphaerales bacterium]
MAIVNDKHFPVMENMTVKSVRSYLQRKQSIIIPVGVIEQHGYHLPLKTDALIATHMARKIGAAADILVAPTMYQSFSGGGCPGTINISPATMSLVMSDLAISLVSQGFRNIYIFLCHGGSENARALDNAIQMLLRMNPAFADVMMCLLPIWECGGKENGYQQGFANKDWHAGWLETSLVMALEPEVVQMDQLEMDAEPYASTMRAHPDNYQRAEKIVDDPCVVPRMTQHPDIKVGVMGYPEQASVEKGKKIAEDIVNAAVARITKLESQADGIYKEVAFTPEPIILITPDNK